MIPGRNTEDSGDRYLTNAQCETIIQRVRSFARNGGTTGVTVTSWWNGELRWARNRVNLAGDRRNVSVVVERDVAGGEGLAETNLLDDVSLEAVVTSAERRSREGARPYGLPVNVLLPPPAQQPAVTIWSDATYNVTATTRSVLANILVERAEAEGMLAAGYLEVRAASRAEWTDDQRPYLHRAHTAVTEYSQLTQAQCSMTVRHPGGLGSGWAGLSSYDWQALDAAALAQRALDKCIASLNPVRIEPGRYTVILEPQAVSEIVLLLYKNLGARPAHRGVAEQYPDEPFYLGIDETLQIGRSKLGLTVVDERITIDHDPEDSTLGVVPQDGMERETFIRNGVLTTLSNNDQYGREKLRHLNGDIARPSFRMSGGTTSMETMIAETKRGLIVTRLWDVRNIDKKSILATGVTRDGLWLVENGAITRAVHNMRFTESPLFILNQVESLGVPVPVFMPVKHPEEFRLTPTIVPPVKVRDFSFPSLVDAI